MVILHKKRGAVQEKLTGIKSFMLLRNNFLPDKADKLLISLINF